MKKSLSLLSGGLALTISLSASAGTIQEAMADYSVKRFADNFYELRFHDKMSKSMTSHEKTQALFQSWERHQDQVQYPDIWADVGIEMINMSARDIASRFTHMDFIDGLSNPIVQQDGLVDLERIRVTNVSHGVHYSNIHDYPMAAGFKPGFQALTSHSLMSQGKPGVGPDNQLIEVCQFGMSQYAPYLELSYTQKAHLERISSLDMTQCLSGDQLKSYWTLRLKDFESVRYDRTERHAPGTSL